MAALPLVGCVADQHREHRALGVGQEKLVRAIASLSENPSA
jgi:hypothetical protein